MGGREKNVVGKALNEGKILAAKENPKQRGKKRCSSKIGSILIASVFTST